MVDDAIVMLENIVRHIEGGMRPFEAALKGSREIGFTIISITFSLIAVFIPVLLMGGMVGRVFREFAVTIAVAIVVSGFVSLTLTPMLCARVLRAITTRRRSRSSCCAWFEAMFRSWLRGLRMVARLGAQIQGVMLVVTLRDARRHGLALHGHPEGLLPARGHRLHRRHHRRRRPTSRSTAMVELQRKVAEIIRNDPAVDYRQFDGRRRRPQPDVELRPHAARLKPMSERKENSTAVIQRLRRTANAGAGHRGLFPEHPEHQLGGRISKSEFQYTLQSSDTEALYRIAPELRAKIEKVEGLRDVTTDLYIKNPQMTIEIDREKAAVYGITVDQIRQELYNAFGSRQIGTIYTPSNDYQIILESMPEFQTDPSALSKIFLKTRADNPATARGGRRRQRLGELTGPSIPLSAVTRLVPSVGPLQVNHQGQQPSVTISFNLAPGVSLGYAVDADPAHRARGRPAGLDHHRLPGHGAGVPGIR